MSAQNRIIEGKRERQRTMDKLSIKSGQAYTYDSEKKSGCRSNEKLTQDNKQRKMNQ